MPLSRQRGLDANLPLLARIDEVFPLIWLHMPGGSGTRGPFGRPSDLHKHDLYVSSHLEDGALLSQLELAAIRLAGLRIVDASVLPLVVIESKGMQELQTLHRLAAEVRVRVLPIDSWIADASPLPRFVLPVQRVAEPDDASAKPILTPVDLDVCELLSVIRLGRPQAEDRVFIDFSGMVECLAKPGRRSPEQMARPRTDIIVVVRARDMVLSSLLSAAEGRSPRIRLVLRQTLSRRPVGTFRQLDGRRVPPSRAIRVTAATRALPQARPNVRPLDRRGGPSGFGLRSNVVTSRSGGGDRRSNVYLAPVGPIQRWGAPMSSVFISYAREDEAHARKIAEQFKQENWLVWTDQEIPPGETWAEVIGTSLEDAACVVVLWTPNSVVSQWVKKEARSGMYRQLLVPVLMEPTTIPQEFEHIEAADFTGGFVRGSGRAQAAPQAGREPRHAEQASR